MSADIPKENLSNFEQSLISYAEKCDDERLLWKIQTIIDSGKRFKLTSGITLAYWLIENKRFNAVQPLINILNLMGVSNEALDFLACTWCWACGERKEALIMARDAAEKWRSSSAKNCVTAMEQALLDDNESHK
jgi:hypothetical protein